MKMILFLLLSASAHAIDYGYLKPEDQKYYKNDSLEGNNQRERIDSLVKEVNKLHAEQASIRAEMLSLKKELEDLKKK